ncbi:MarR family winged helix-turn-helix transcriptional regulator [Microbacterium sp. K2]|uniref:MarR family winged helix-turn-helix transcriptional regulator n=1 Tax=Microbacterium sp. K2 TaxID=3391827 RepID=UPI003ED9CB1A
MAILTGRDPVEYAPSYEVTMILPEIGPAASPPAGRRSPRHPPRNRGLDQPEHYSFLRRRNLVDLVILQNLGSGRFVDPFTELCSRLRHTVEKQLRDVGKLSCVQFQLLAWLGDPPGGSQQMSDLADGVVYSRSGLTCKAQSLEERGLVTRGPSPEDDHSTIVAITDEGREVLAECFRGTWRQ